MDSLTYPVLSFSLCLRLPYTFLSYSFYLLFSLTLNSSLPLPFPFLLASLSFPFFLFVSSFLLPPFLLSLSPALSPYLRSETTLRHTYSTNHPFPSTPITIISIHRFKN